LFKLNLVLHRKNDNTMIFSPAPWFRILFLFLAVVVIIGIFTTSEDEEGGNWVPVIVITVCIAAALYEESWRFDRSKRIIISKTGIIFLHKTKTWSFAEIANFELMVFLRGAESDGSADHEINLSKPFSRENTDEISGRGIKIIHRKYHQELRLSLKSGDRITIESIDSRNTEGLLKKANTLSEFCGIQLTDE